MSESILGPKRRRFPPMNPADHPAVPYYGGSWQQSPGAPEPTVADLSAMLARMAGLVDKWRKRAEGLRRTVEIQRREIRALQAEAINREKVIAGLERRLDNQPRKG